jgi:hypothetical protein
MKSRGSVLLLMAVAGVMFCSSCVKKYTCQCRVTFTGKPGLPDSTAREYEVYNTQSGAKSICEEASYEKEQNGIKTKEECSLY